MGLPRVLTFAVLACACGGDPDGPIVPVDATQRTVTVAWKVADLADVEIPCETLGAQFVTVNFVRTRNGQGFTEVFDCFRGSGSRTLDEGEYMIGLELADGFGMIATVPPQRYLVTGDLALDDATFEVEPFGSLDFTLDTGQPANCDAATQITGMSIALSHTDGTCEPARLTIEPSTPYTVDCASPVTTSCIEKDRRVTAARLPAGEYRIRVVGLQGANPCWLSDQRERVRGAGLPRSLVLPMMKTCP